MAWPEKTQFKAVERLAVPPEVDASFRRVQSAQVGQGYAKGLEKRLSASTKLESSVADAAQHFGGDAEKAMVHYKRWQRWGKTAMSPAGIAEDVAAGIASNVSQINFKKAAMEEEHPSPTRMTKPGRTKA